MPERTIIIPHTHDTSKVDSPFTSTPGVGVVLHPRGVLIKAEPVFWEIPKEFKGIMGYNPRHDIQDYLDLKSLNGKIPPEEYAQLLIQTNNRTKRQIEKALGERFGVEKSTIEYFIVTDGRLYSPDYPGPIVEEYEKGRRFLTTNGSTETERETAEVEGIAKIQELFTNTSEVSPGSSEVEEAKIIVISPQSPEGSLYTENLFDVYQKKSGKINMTRYHSTHSLESFLKAAQAVSPQFRDPSEGLNAAFFLKTPIRSQKSLEEILAVFGFDKSAQKYQVNQQIIEACTPFILAYIRTLIENPLDIEKIKLTLNAIYNVADLTEKQLREEKKTTYATCFLRGPTSKREFEFSEVGPQNTNNLINHFGRQPVRPVARGCPGGQKGFNVSQPPLLKQLARAIGAKSVLDFAPFTDDEDEDTSDFQCPGWKVDPETDKKEKCTYIIRYGSGVRKCPGCGMEATCG